MKKQIWIICAEQENQIGITAYQLATKARTLHEDAELYLTAVCIGNFELSDIKRLFCAGVHKVLLCEQGNLDRWLFSSIVKEIINRYQKPDLIIIPSSDWGYTCAAELSIVLQAGLIADCVDISLDSEGKYIFSRAAINDSVVAKIQCVNCTTGICTVKKNSFKEDYNFELVSKNIKVINDAGIEKHFFPKVLRIEQKLQIKSENIEWARIVFGVGRGIRNLRTYQLLCDVAHRYEAEIVGTRALVEMGFIDKGRQVGQSGITIAPELYIAFGISGASQHMVGVRRSKKIIAVNDDENARIFNYCDIAIVDKNENVLRQMLANYV